MGTELTLKLPKLVFVNDYNELRPLQDYLRTLAGTKRVKVNEVGFDACGTQYNQYIGIVYTSKDADYRRLIKKAKEWLQIEILRGVVGF